MDDKESGDGPHADAGENNGAHHNSGLALQASNVVTILSLGENLIQFV